MKPQKRTELAEMKMSGYNDYPGATRARGGEWQKAAYRTGLRRKPTLCVACGEADGLIFGHWETYDEPFELNEDIGLCSICHLWVHCRRRFAAKFLSYAASIAEGARPERPMASFDWNGFQAQWLKRDSAEWEFSWPTLGQRKHDPGVVVGILDRIASGEELARVRASRT